MAAVWARILRVDTVSAEDNFIDLSGDSLQAMIVASEAKRSNPELFSALTLEMFFRQPTLRALVAACLAADVGAPGR